MEEKKFYYVYQITNKINGKIYIGIHATNDLDDSYMGSGLALHNAFRKYGIDNFVKNILFFGTTYQEILNKEAEIVTKDFILREDVYNLRTGGFGGSTLAPEKELERKQKGIEATKLALSGFPRSEETKKRISEAMKGRIPHNKGKTIAPIEKRICEVCQEEFEVRIGRNGTGKCCSRSCAAKLMNSRKLNRHYGSANGSKLN